MTTDIHRRRADYRWALLANAVRHRGADVLAECNALADRPEPRSGEIRRSPRSGREWRLEHDLGDGWWHVEDAGGSPGHLTAETLASWPIVPTGDTLEPSLCDTGHCNTREGCDSNEPLRNQHHYCCDCGEWMPT